jgi:hypothetical protein
MNRTGLRRSSRTPVCDWLHDRFNGVALKHSTLVWLDPAGAGLNAASVSHKRR